MINSSFSFAIFHSLLLFVFRLHWRLLLTMEDELIKTLTSKSTYCHFFNISSGKATCKICKVSFSYDQQKSGFEEYAADREFHGYDTPVPRKLEMFIKFKLNKISTSEAAVERCFSSHKLIHSPMRASLSDEIVDKLLFIRYNHIIKYPGFVTFDKPEDDAALNELEEFEVF